MGQLPTSRVELDHAAYTTTQIMIDYYHNLGRGQLDKMIPIAEEHIPMTMLTIYLEEQSALREKIEVIIPRFIAHGMQTKWMRDYGIMVEMHSKRDKIPQQLTLNQVLGVFIISGGLYILALIVFVTELFSKRLLKNE